MAFKSDLDTMILAVLRTESMHGYEIAKAIKLRSSDVLKVGEGQLYPALHILEKDGLVKAEWEQQQGKPAKKIYSLTEEGAKKLAKQKKEWDSFVAGVGAILNLEGGHV